MPTDPVAIQTCSSCGCRFRLRSSLAPTPEAATLDLPANPSLPPDSVTRPLPEAATLDLPTSSSLSTPKTAVNGDANLNPALAQRDSATLALPAAPASPGSDKAPVRIGRFRIEKKLGEGSFGRVYLAYDPTLRRQVALKVARQEATRQPAGRPGCSLVEPGVDLYEREAQNAAHLQYPHIVPVYDCGRDGPQRYIATGYVAGKSLAQRLEALALGETLPQREAVEMVRNLAEALAYAHQEGVIHSDIKPGNTMVRDNGELLLMDFGLAARRHDDAEDGSGRQSLGHAGVHGSGAVGGQGDGGQRPVQPGLPAV